MDDTILRIETRSKIADTAQTLLVGYLYLLCFSQQIAHRAIHGETGAETCLSSKELQPRFSRLRFRLFFRVQCFCDQPHTQSESVNEALAFVQTIQLSDSILEFAEQFLLVFIHGCFERGVMPEHQLGEPVAFAVLLDITLEWVNIAIIQFSDRIHVDTVE